MEVMESAVTFNGTIPAVLAQLDVITDDTKCLKKHEITTLALTGELFFNMCYILCLIFSR